jgi:AbrB family looped-hinge helix DNA binding protein
MKAKLDRYGRLTIPARFRRALDLRPGDVVQMILSHGEIRLTNGSGAVRRAQELVRMHNKEKRSLVDDLLRQRRDELRRTCGR